MFIDGCMSTIYSQNELASCYKKVYSKIMDQRAFALLIILHDSTEKIKNTIATQIFKSYSFFEFCKKLNLNSISFD